MKLGTVLLLCFGPLLTYAEETQEKKKDFSGYQTMDMKQFEGLESKPKSDVQFSVTCRSPEGREIKPHEEGYEACMVRSANKPKKD